MRKLMFLTLIMTLLCCVPKTKVITVKAPEGSLVCEVTTDDNGHLVYSIEFQNRKVILPSSLGVIIDDDDIGSNAMITGKASLSNFSEVYPTRGVHSQAVNNYNAAVIPVTGGASQTEWSFEVRVFPDAVAYRYIVKGEGPRKITGESSAWNMIAGAKMWYQADRKKDYEMPFFTMMPDTLSQPLHFMTTATFKLPDNLGYAKISEANLIDYSDMALIGKGNGIYESNFHNSPDGWEVEGEIVSPWRVVILTADLNGMVNTDVFHNLSPAPSPELVNAEWIKPGKSTWAWMVTGSPDLKDQKKWIGWTSDLGFEYYLIDDGWQKWNEGGKGQWEHMKELVDYAATKNVELWAWVHTQEVTSKDQRDVYLKNAKDVGLVGLKVDFMGGANPRWVQWYDEILSETAALELMINFHGANKPTGRERTWPHEMTREGIRGREMGKQPALHDTSLPFTRFVNGHADYTPTDFRPERLKGSTWAHELAMAITFTSPLMVMAGDPVTYLASEARDLMKNLPAEWDETIVLPGSEIGETAAFARRKGDQWYLGVINGPATSLTIKTDFLPEGKFAIEEFMDVENETNAWRHTKYEIDQKTEIYIPLNRDGGYVARIYKTQK